HSTIALNHALPTSTPPATPCSAVPACQTQQTTLATIGLGQNPLKTSTPEAAYSGRSSHNMSCWGCSARAPRRAPTTAHTDLTGPRPAPPPALPRKKGTVPHAPPRTFDRRPLRAPLPARCGRNGNRVACLGPLPTP